jgi:hypothetical protein
MAITTLAGAVSGIKRVNEMQRSAQTYTTTIPLSHFFVSGYPTPAAAPTPGIGGTTLTSYAGQINFDNPSSGNTYLYNFTASNQSLGTVWLCDRLWHNSGITITSNTEQTFTGSVDIPARDMNGAALGHGVFAAVEVSSTVGSGTPTLTLKYKNQDNAEKTATNIMATVANAAAGSFYVIGLAAGDTGIRRAVSLTLSATWTSGTIHVVLYRPIAKLAMSSTFGSGRNDSQNNLCCVSVGFPRLYDNSVPFIVHSSGTSNTTGQSATVQFTQG